MTIMYMNMLVYMYTLHAFENVTKHSYMYMIMVLFILYRAGDSERYRARTNEVYILYIHVHCIHVPL